MASFFGYHYVQGLLAETGWPRRKSFFNSKAVIDSNVLDIAIGQMIDWGASIGACRHKLALQIIATMFRDADWNKFGLLDMINDFEEKWEEMIGIDPIEIVNPTKFSQYSKLTDAVILNDKKMQSAFENYFYEALLWGLNYPDIFEIYYENKREKQIERLPEYKKAGIGIDRIPTLEDDLNDAVKIIRLYEEKMQRALSPIPQRLLDDVESLGIEINA